LWTTDPDEQQRFAVELQAGQVFVNGMVVSMPPLPFGGIKSSGFGRELSAHGLREFCNVKSVWIA
jgi:succinate-semialdehyde dehydrogenase/glutarate-semialdehyde dehydrogenase